MTFFLVDTEGHPVGPYSREDLRLFLDRGLIEPHTQVIAGPDEKAARVDWILAQTAPPPPRAAGERDHLPPPPTPPSATQDFLRLAPHLMLPLGDLRRLPWRENRRILALAFVGLAPLLLILYLNQTQNLAAALWGVALYSSLLWALFFYIIFAPSGIHIGRSLLSFVGSAIFSISLVALARWIVPFQWVLTWINAPSVSTRWAGHLVGVALVEEVAKLFPLYFLWPARLRPRAMMFYGLVSGLGFGIYEGVAYQSSYNLQVSFMDGIVTQEGAGLYYMLNILRITSLPFLHAMWTGIAGYFLGLAAQFPRRPGGALLAAVIVPSTLHSTYNTFSTGLAGVIVALVTVLALNLYLFKGQDFEQILENPNPQI